MKKLIFLSLILFAFLAACAQERFQPKHQVQTVGTLSKDGNFYYIFDFTLSKMAKWDVRKGEIAAWIEWSDFQETDDYIPEPKLKEGIYACGDIGTTTHLLLTVDTKKKNQLQLYDPSSQEFKQKVALCNGTALGYDMAVNDEGTYVAFVAVTKDKVDVFDVANGTIVYSIPWSGNQQGVYFALCGPWFTYRDFSTSTERTAPISIYNLETRAIHNYTFEEMNAIFEGISSFAYLPKSGQIVNMVTIKDVVHTRVIDPETWAVESTVAEHLIRQKQDDYNNWYVTPDDRIVYYRNLKQESAFQIFQYLGVIGLYDPVRDYLLNEQVLNQEKTIDGLYKVLVTEKLWGK